MATIYSLIVSTHLRNDLNAFKINSSDIFFILFLLNSSLKRTNISTGCCICIVFKNVPYNVIKGVKVWA